MCIASYKDFQKLGYQLQKGEKSLSILAPSMQKLFKDEKGISKLLNYAGEQGLHIKVGKTDSAAKGYYVPSTNEIVLRDTLNAKEKAKVLLHEMAHAEMHHSSKITTKSKDMRTIDVLEYQAEITAFIVSNTFGLDSENYSKSYLAIGLSVTLIILFM
uniref:DUF6782 family putative metallopeptidase n=1 Tax=Carnobacterium sp. TaxID=48221 RepID=UPI003450DFA3